MNFNDIACEIYLYVYRKRETVKKRKEFASGCVIHAFCIFLFVLANFLMSLKLLWGVCVLKFGVNRIWRLQEC